MKALILILILSVNALTVFSQKVYLGITAGVNTSQGHYIIKPEKEPELILDKYFTPAYGLNGAYYINENISIPFGIQWNFPMYGTTGTGKNLEMVITKGDTMYWGVAGRGSGVNIRNNFIGIRIEKNLGASKVFKYHYSMLPSINKNLVSKKGLTDNPFTDTIGVNAIAGYGGDYHFIWQPSIFFNTGVGLYTKRSIIRLEVSYHTGFSLLDSRGFYVRVPYTQNQFDYGRVGYNGAFLFTGISYSYKLWEKKNNKG